MTLIFDKMDSALNWLASVGYSSQLKPLNSDASFRSYWQLSSSIRNQIDGSAMIFMNCPPKNESLIQFLDTAKLLSTNKQWKVPKIYDFNLEKGFALIEYFGDELFEKHYRLGQDQFCIQKALESLISFQQLETSTSLANYDEFFLMQEMNLFDDWFMTKHCHHNLNSAESSMLANSKKLLIENILSQKQVLVHRDFHSRNLFLLTRSGEKQIGVIDFQDAINGAVTYDVVSLLKDCYWELDNENREKLLYQYWQGSQTKMTNFVNWDKFVRDFDYMSIQRHLKILGVFCRLYYRDAKDSYLQYLPITLKYLLETTSKYKDFTKLHNYLKKCNVVLTT